MHLYNIIATSILSQINTVIGSGGYVDFFANTTNIPATGMLNASSRVKFGNPAIGTISTTTGDPANTQAVGAFTAMAAGTVQTGTTANYFAIFNSAGSTLFTGSVGAATGSDLVFNTNVWVAGDNVNITSLNFLAPQV